MAGERTADEGDPGKIGARVAVLRTTRGLTQQALAQRAHVSSSLLRKVERGQRRPTPAFTAAVALALGVPVSSVTEPAGNDAAGDEPLRTALVPVRTALDALDLDPDDTITPCPLPVLAAAVHRINRQAQTAEYEPMVAALPALLGELHTATATLTGRDQERAWTLLAEATRCGHSVGIATGFIDLSVTALARTDWAARRAGDWAPGWRAAREYLRITAYLRIQDFEMASRCNAAGLAHLDGASDAPGALVARGQLYLGAAIIAAQTGDRDTMAALLAEACQIAAVTGEQTEQFWFGFGPTNVTVHRTMALAALGEFGQAVDASEGLEFPRDWLPTRIGHHHLDLARAWRWLNRSTEALDALHQARAVAPGQAKRHPLARDTVTALLHTARRRSPELTAYATWIGI